jgi:hyperosmotically inducible periplasmic protein
MREQNWGNVRHVAVILLTAALGLSGLVAAPRTKKQGNNLTRAPIADQVRHNLLMLPYYGVFDNLTFQIQGNDVILKGDVVRPTLKSDAAGAVRRIEGVGKVINDIKVLPLSPFDNRLRQVLYRRIYSTPGLDLYALRSIPTIHIIVDNGNVTLVGAVGREMDKTLAGMAAREVPGSFSVKNDLTVVKG